MIVVPRDYQKVAVQAIKKAFKTKGEALVVMATGLGKTYVAAFWSKNKIRKGKKGLFLCHNNHILDQSIEKFRKVLGSTVSLKSFYGNDKDWRADEATILFASFKTLGVAGWRKVFFEDEFDFVIVDESHHGPAPTYLNVINYFKPENLLGLTATPERMDEKDIREIFGDPIVEITLEEAIANNWLSPIEYHMVSDGLSHWKLKKLTKDVLEKGKRVSIKQLNETVFIDARDEEIAEIIQEHSGKRKKTIIFCERRDHAENFSQFLPRTRTGVCHYKKGIEVNRRIIHSFREGSLQFLLAVNQVNEGVDVPDAEVIVFLRCTDSKTIFLQQLGRGLRKIAGKNKVIVLDFVANCDRIVMVKEMIKRVSEFVKNHNEIYKDVLRVSGKGFDFIFDNNLIDILEILERIRPKYISDVPHLLEEYSEKNDFPPNQVRTGTNMYLWWNCRKCGAEFQMRGNNRLLKRGCKRCKSLLFTHPYLAEEYSPKNLIPVDKITKGSHRKVLWVCSECKHEWNTQVKARTSSSHASGCPMCAPGKARERRRNSKWSYH